MGVEKTRVGSVQLCCNVSEGRGSQQMGSMEECGNERFEANRRKVLIEMVPQNKRQVLVGLLCLLLTRDSIYEDKTNVSFG